MRARTAPLTACSASETAPGPMTCFDRPSADPTATVDGTSVRTAKNAISAACPVVRCSCAARTTRTTVAIGERVSLSSGLQRAWARRIGALLLLLGRRASPPAVRRARTRAGCHVCRGCTAVWRGGCQVPGHCVHTGGAPERAACRAPVRPPSGRGFVRFLTGSRSGARASRAMVARASQFVRGSLVQRGRKPRIGARTRRRPAACARPRGRRRRRARRPGRASERRRRRPAGRVVLRDARRSALRRRRDLHLDRDRNRRGARVGPRRRRRVRRRCRPDGAARVRDARALPREPPRLGPGRERDAVAVRADRQPPAGRLPRLHPCDAARAGHREFRRRGERSRRLDRLDRLGPQRRRDLHGRERPGRLRGLPRGRAHTPSRSP